MMVDPANREETDAPAARSSRVRTVGETPRRGDGDGARTRAPQRRSSRGNRRPGPVSNRPGAGRTGNSARFIAPLALAIVAIACFSVLSSSDEGNGNKEPLSNTKSSSTKSSDSGGGTTVVTTKKTYVVKAGDSFAAIAEKLNVDVDTLQELNPDVDPRALQPGEKLKLR